MKVKRILLLTLAVLLIFTASVAPSVYAAGETDSYDYSRTGSYFNTVYTSADILELIGYSLSEGERAYLNEYGALNVKYETVTAQQISITSIDGTTRISARPYTYVGANGSTVAWTPVSASIDGDEKTLTPDGGVYIADFDGVGDDTAVNVRYDMTSVTVRASDVNAILGVAHDDAVALKEEIALYTENAEEIAEYFTRLALYNEYVGKKLVYDQKKSAYDKYLSDLAVYAIDLESYEAYIEQLEEYNRIKDNNDNYEANLKNYNEVLLPRYEKYVEDLKTVDVQFKMMYDGFFTRCTYHKRHVYNSVYSDVFEIFLANKDALHKILGVNENDIDNCVIATNNLREILDPEGGTPFKEIKTAEEKQTFYVSNYELIRDNMILLAKSLQAIYFNDNVQSSLDYLASALGKDYSENLAIFLSQLIIFMNVLTDEQIMANDGVTVLDESLSLSYYDANKVYRSNVKVLDVLEGNRFVKDIDQVEPINLVEVAKPEMPKLLELPTPPTEVLKPTEPAEVADPGKAPETVAEPTRPPFAPAEPSRLEIVDNEIYALLIADLDAGLLDGGREPITDDVTFTPTVTLRKNLVATDMIELTFLDTDGSVITTLGTERGTALNFTDELPEKQEDISASYVFAAWVTEDGEVYDLSAVSEDVTLYPSFTPIYKEYPIGDDNGAKYLDVTFTGDKLADVPVAHFIELAIASRLGVRLTAEDTDGVAASINLTYTAVTELYGEGVTRMSFVPRTASLGDFSFAMTAYTADGEEVQGIDGIYVSLPCSDETFARRCTVYVDGVEEKVTKSYLSGMMTFSAKCAKSYSFVLKYALGVNTGISAYVSVPEYAVPGDTVTVSVSVPAGTLLDGLYYMLLSDNTRHPIEGDSFVMPYGNVRLGASVTVLEYTVKFISDGKVISERGGYKYGDTVIVPNNPTKLSDGTYSYTFIGWSPEISTVSGDVVCVAQFEATPIPVQKERMSVAMLVYYIVVFLLIALGALILLLVLKKLGVFKKRPKNPTPTPEDPSDTANDNREAT